MSTVIGQMTAVAEAEVRGPDGKIKDATPTEEEPSWPQA